MIENKGDLISRSALLKTFSNSKHIKETTSGLVVMEMLAIKEVIDNAPTVTTFTLEDIEGIRAETIKMMKNRYARPQGEWNYIQAGMCVCSFCGAMPHEEYKNFCAKCGADMRGKKNE